MASRLSLWVAAGGASWRTLCVGGTVAVGGGGLVTLTSRFTPSCLQHLLQPLEFRMACVGAASTGHLCKSMIMENTRAHPSVDGWSNPLNSRYYVVIVQYTARLHPDKIKNFVHKLGGGLVRSVAVAGPGNRGGPAIAQGLAIAQGPGQQRKVPFRSRGLGQRGQQGPGVTGPCIAPPIHAII